jgi:two-component system LytT family response regulator
MKGTDKIKAIIIDDEELARKVIVKYLENHPRVEIIQECENGFAGLKAINELKPDLVFLDIQMPKINGFEMLDVLDEKPLIIFSTAHDDFAIKAFEHNAVDYLLKPYSQKRFTEALNKAVEKIGPGTPVQTEIQNLQNSLSNSPENIRRVVIKSGSSVEVLPVDDILFLEAAGDYVEIHTAKGKYLKQKAMSYFEHQLNPEQFIRVHRSYIVAVHQITKFEPYSKDSFILFLKNGKEISVSKSGYKNLKERLGF